MFPTQGLNPDLPHRRRILYHLTHKGSPLHPYPEATLSTVISAYPNSKEIQPVHPKEDQSWVFIGRTDAESETPILWPPHVKS